MPLIRAARSLLRTPASTLACIVTLSLGVAVSTSMFSLLDALLWRALPFAQPEQLASIEPSTSWGDVLDFESHARQIKASGVYFKRTWGFTDSTQGPVEVVLSGMVTHGFFDALRIVPEMGTAFTSGMEAPGANRVMWLTDGFFRRRYGRREVIGSMVALNDVPYRIAGILPASFRFPMDGENPDIYIPLDRTDYCCRRDLRTLSGIARLAPGATRESAQQELSALTGDHTQLVDLERALLGTREKPLIALGLAAALLMLVAAINGASILLARAAAKLRESAVKVSLGAGFGHLVREQLTVGILLGGAATGSGIALALLLMRLLHLIPSLAAILESVSAIATPHLDARAVLFAASISFFAAIAASLIPVLLMKRRSMEALMRSGGSGSRGIALMRNTFVVAQIAASAVLLLAGAVVFAHLREVLSANKGFHTENILMAAIGIPEARYDTDAKMIDFHQRVIEKLKAIPGVEAAAGGVRLPLGGRSRFLPVEQQMPEKDRPRVVVGVASPELFPLLGVPVLQGRNFVPSDRYDHPYVAIVNHAFATRYGRGVGRRLEVGFWNGHMKPWPEVDIVGVVADARNHLLEEAPEPAIYLSALQIPLEGFDYFVHTTRPAESIRDEFRRAVWSVDSNLESVTPHALGPFLERGLEPRRVAVWLIGMWGALGLAMAAAGMGASISAWVTESRREIAIRAALGASPIAIRRAVLIRATRVCATGLLIGIPAGIVTVRLLRSQIPGVGDARFFPALVVTLLIASVAVGASWLPARRAARLDPMDVLRTF